MTIQEKAINQLERISEHLAAIGEKEDYTDIAIKALEQYCEDVGELSDGYHTFNQLYHQRAILFAAIVNQNKDKAWKSFKHSDGKYCFDSDGEWFIVGVDTPQGSYTYHYAKEYWDMFDCQELECGKEWDGHTEKDVTRLLSLEQQPNECTEHPCLGKLCRYYKQPNKDCISRAYIEPIVEELENICINGDEHILSLLSDIKNAPPVTPQPKIGHWRHYEGMLICSECGAEFYDDIMEYCGDDVPKCCPDCGSYNGGNDNGDE